MYGRTCSSNPPTHSKKTSTKFRYFGLLPLIHIWDWSIYASSITMSAYGPASSPQCFMNGPVGGNGECLKGFCQSVLKVPSRFFMRPPSPAFHCGKLWENCIAASEGEEMSSAYLRGWQNCSTKRHLYANLSFQQVICARTALPPNVHYSPKTPTNYIKVTFP